MIQEFPRRWSVQGTPTQQYEQLGNAVPLRLAEIVGKVVGDALVKVKGRGKSRLARRLLPSRRVYLNSTVRTRKWYQKGHGVILGKRGKFLTCPRPKRILAN